jgi:hypothetical protein
MTNIDFGIGAQRIQGDSGMAPARAAQREQQAALFNLQAAALVGGSTLDAASEQALGVILTQYDGSGDTLVTGDITLFPEDMRPGLNDIFTNLKSAGMIAGFSLDFSTWSAVLTPAGLLYFEDRQKTIKREGAPLKKLTPDSAKLLLELVSSDEPAVFLRARFERSNDAAYKDISLMLRELISEGYIRVPVWKDDIPQYVELDDAALAYAQYGAEPPAFNPHIRELKLKDAADDSESPKRYDLFIAYAGRDKSVYTDEQYSSLSRLGVDILYDGSVLSWGEDRKQKIQDGAAAAEFSVLVIPESLFGDDDWTEKELSTLLRRKNKHGQLTVIPLLHTATPQDFIKKYPSLSGVECLSAADTSHDGITILCARKLLQRLKQM